MEQEGCSSFFVYYSAPLRAGAPDDWDHTSVISEFRVSQSDMNKANQSGERILLRDNPFVGKDGKDEIFAFGLRNPFRISFDAGGKHELFAGDAGQNRFEEVDIITRGSNYGWNIKEGAHCFDPGNPDVSPDKCPDFDANGLLLVDPILEYRNAKAGGIGVAVIGGFVYRGSALPRFNGSYIFGDFSTKFNQGDGTLFIATPPPPGEKMWSMKELRIASSENGRINAFVRSFGQDASNELYVLTSENAGPEGSTGKAFKIVP